MAGGRCHAGRLEVAAEGTEMRGAAVDDGVDRVGRVVRLLELDDREEPLFFADAVDQTVVTLWL
jgi:hypothetical protein